MQLIETGARILRRHWKGLIAGAAVFGTVGLILSETAAVHFSEVLNSLLTIDPSGAPIFDPSAADTQRLGEAAVASIGGALISAACLTIASLVASLYVDRDYRGGSITLRAAIAFALRRAPVAIAAWLVTILVAAAIILATAFLALLAIDLIPPADGGSGGLGAFLALIVAVAGFVALVTVSIRWTVAPAVVALEPVGPLQALRRAWHLSAENAWRILGLQLLVVFVVSIVTTVVSEVLSATVLDGLGSAPSLQFGLQVSLSVVIAVLTAPVLPVMLTALYFDLRVRRDRFELTLVSQS